MNNTTENTEKLRIAYQLWAETKGGSVDHWMDLMADEVDFRSLAAGSARIEFTDTCCNKDEVKGYFDGLVSGWEMIDYTVDEYIAEGNRVVAPRKTATPENRLTPQKRISLGLKMAKLSDSLNFMTPL